MNKNSHKKTYPKTFLSMSICSIIFSSLTPSMAVNAAESAEDIEYIMVTGSRIKKAKPYIGDEDFLLTYGDGVADIDIDASIEFHKSHGKIVTMTSAQPDGRFGALAIDSENKVTEFNEKPKGDGSWINAGYFVCKADVLDYISDGDDVIFEQTPLTNLSKEGQLFTYKHNGFWMPMDTLRDKLMLDGMCNKNTAPWITWNK